MSLYSIYFTQVLLPLLDLRYSQSHSNITIATENAFVLFFFFVIFQNSFVIFVHFRVLQIMSKFFCVCFQKFAATYIKKKFCHVSVSHEYFFSRVFFSIHFHRNHWSPYSIFSTIQYNINMTWRNYKWYEWSFCSRRMTSEFQFKLEMLS